MKNVLEAFATILNLRVCSYSFRIVELSLYVLIRSKFINMKLKFTLTYGKQKIYRYIKS